MFGLSFAELLLIMTVLLLVFGPERLPDAARSFGRILSRLRRAADSFNNEVRQALEASDLQDTWKDTGGVFRSAAADVRKGIDDLLKPDAVPSSPEKSPPEQQDD